MNNLAELLKNDDYIYGLRVDDYEYDLEDICNNSHELYQDPEFDEDNELVYPYIEEGYYKGFYDGGELFGTCAIRVNESNIEEALNMTETYEGNHIYLLRTDDRVREGNDEGEIIMENAEVVYILK